MDDEGLPVNREIIQVRNRISEKTVGNTVPNEAKIIFKNQQYYLENKGNSTFSYLFTDVQEPINFYIEANGVQSQNYQINVIGTPTIQNISLKIKYPNYLGRGNEIIKNSGNLTVPEGTLITWRVQTIQTDSLAFKKKKKRVYFLNPDN